MVKLFLFILIMALKPKPYVPSVEDYVSPHDDYRQEIHVTWYVNPNHNKTASGGETFIGCCASNKEHLGDIACLYSIDGYFIGYYEATDTGGAEWLENGTCIDIYVDDLGQMYRMAEEWGTEYLVHWVEADG